MPLHHPVSLSLSRNIASGGFISGSGTGKAYPDKLTRNVFVTCIIASMAGFIFDYDIGISSIKRETFECEEKVTNYHSLELKWSVKEEEVTRAITSTNKSEGRELIMAKLFACSNSPAGMFDARVMKPALSRKSSKSILNLFAPLQCLFTTPFLSLSLENIASGGFVSSSGTGKAYPDKLTRNVVVTCIIASMAGFILSYDIGISR
ncbi:hypothetical protein RHMOL_Rhmol02G0276700 [Rhododendron molle]|uniref:Uncharacterized protein n=1 Tax=Rhododendron molle TaxID=49168 RepID=A0ACC0PUH3_RHOML|nr:hypothetical protein RHMOL_Rhmol02G0276700 [Rhododendron molle]